VASSGGLRVQRLSGTLPAQGFKRCPLFVILGQPSSFRVRMAVATESVPIERQFQGELVSVNSSQHLQRPLGAPFNVREPNKAFHRTFSPSLRFGKTAGELWRWASHKAS